MNKYPKINEWLTMVEKEMRVSLARLLATAVQNLGAIMKGAQIDNAKFLTWVDENIAQLVVLASQVSWSESVDAALTAISTSGNKTDLTPINGVLEMVEATLNVLADSVLHEQPPVRRRKLEHLVSRREK